MRAVEAKVLQLPLTKAQKKQLTFIANEYEMYEKDVLVALIKREAIKLSKKLKEEEKQ